MKNFRRTMRHFIPSIIFSIMFTLLFPYSIMAQQTEYKVPENSMSYLVMAQSDAATQPPPIEATANQDASLSASDRKDLEPEFEPQTAETAKIQIIPEPVATEVHATVESAAKTTVKAEPAQKSVVKTAEVKNPDYEIAAPAAITEPATKGTPSASSEPTLAAVPTQQVDTPIFAEALSKMQQNKAHREAEAARLGIVLPSQGGDMAAVSPSLSKIQQTLKAIMAR